MKKTILSLTLIICFLVMLFIAYRIEHSDVKKKAINQFTIEVSDPIVVAQNPDANALGWGYFQYPRLYREEDGTIICQIAYKPDSWMTYTGEYLYFASTDDGDTWIPYDNYPISYEIKMSNGCYWQGVEFSDANQKMLKGKYKPYYEKDRFSLYNADQVNESDYAHGFLSEEYDPKTGKVNMFNTTFNWPNKAIVENIDLVFPSGGWFFNFKMHTPGMIIEEDGSLFAAVQSYGDEGTNEGEKYGNYLNVYFVRSDDNARTWNLISKIVTPKTLYDDKSNGLCEPCLIATDNGDFFVLMRSGNESPLYYSVSYDKGKTWSKPMVFDSYGVSPQLLRLPNGVVLSSYGRPGIFIRATNDEDCLIWQSPIRIDDVAGDTFEEFTLNSCGYSSILEINDNTALLVYSNFEYPLEKDDKQHVKTILARKIHVELSK